MDIIFFTDRWKFNASSYVKELINHISFTLTDTQGNDLIYLVVMLRLLLKIEFKYKPDIRSHGRRNYTI
jgi:hypothetical protein